MFINARVLVALMCCAAAARRGSAVGGGGDWYTEYDEYSAYSGLRGELYFSEEYDDTSYEISDEEYEVKHDIANDNYNKLAKNYVNIPRSWKIHNGLYPKYPKRKPKQKYNDGSGNFFRSDVHYMILDDIYDRDNGRSDNADDYSYNSYEKPDIYAIFYKIVDQIIKKYNTPDKTTDEPRVQYFDKLTNTTTNDYKSSEHNDTDLTEATVDLT